MRLLQVTTFDKGGGAEKIAWQLHTAAKSRGHASHILAGWKRSASPDVTQLVPTSLPGSLMYRAVRRINRSRGLQAHGYLIASQWWKNNKQNYDLVHFHNIHGEYISLSFLELVARTTPVVITLHDAWLLTGHCAHPMECRRWEKECGSCPHPEFYPSIERDRTTHNIRHKQKILAKVNPYLVSPSQWLANMVQTSPVTHNLRCEVIPNGVNTNIFHPGDSTTAKQQLNLPSDKFVVLYVANRGLASTWHKDPDLLLNALRLARQDDCGKDIHLVVAGGVSEVPSDLVDAITQLGYVDPGKMPELYRAADVLAYPTKADNCPLGILEAMASGCPIIATNVGGVPELIYPKQKDGFIVPQGDVKAFAASFVSIIMQSREAATQKKKARHVSQRDISEHHMLDQYFSVYRKL